MESTKGGTPPSYCTPAARPLQLVAGSSGGWIEQLIVLAIAWHSLALAGPQALLAPREKLAQLNSRSFRKGLHVTGVRARGGGCGVKLLPFPSRYG